MSLASKIEARYGPNGFPVSDCLGSLRESLSEQRLVALTAPPGSGKTMMVPTALWESGGYSSVYVLEPRRVTARLPALALEKVCGPKVGYQIRFESRWDQAETKIGYLTYGTALRVFAARPPESDSLIVFDEFHERQWEAELLLALLRAQSNGPRLLLMSATLERASLPPEVPVIESDGRLHKVSVSHEAVDPQLMGRRDRLVNLVAERSAEWAARERGEQLIFLPGLGDIRAVQEKLLADHLEGPVDILHSTLPESEIKRVVERGAKSGFRRILSTDIAESSVTLPGIKVVLDSGMVRRPTRDSLDLGVTLRTESAPLSSLQQRAGRAGRLGPGFCHRLFTLRDELHRSHFPRPQMEQADYKAVLLFLASLERLESWIELPWLYAPNEQRLESARRWATEGALVKPDGRLTALGAQVLRFPLDPRSASFAIRAKSANHPVKKILSWCSALEHPPADGASWSLEDWSRKSDIDKRLERQLGSALSAVHSGEESTLEAVLLITHGDTLAQLSNDRAVCAHPEQPALALQSTHPPEQDLGVLLASAPKGGAGPASLCTLFHPVSREQVWESLFEQIEEKTELYYDREKKAVRLLRENRLQSIVLESQAQSAPPGRSTALLLRDNLSDDDLGEFVTFARRLSLYAEHTPQADLPTAEELLLSYLETIYQWSKNSPTQLLAHAVGLLPYPTAHTLDQELPTSIELPGRRRPAVITYPAEENPYVSSKLQDFMGWTPPRLLGGKVPLVCRLLAPNGRPCQITTDLDAFWSGSYQQVRKDLRGRYPKHHWPEDPSRNPRP